MPAPLLIQATLAIPASHAAAWTAGSTTLMMTSGGATTTLVSSGTIVGTATLSTAAPAAVGAATGVVGGGVATSTGVAALLASAPIIVPVAALTLVAVGGTVAVLAVKRGRSRKQSRTAGEAPMAALQAAEDIVDDELALVEREIETFSAENELFFESNGDRH